MKYHALFVIFEKAAKFLIVVCCKIIGGALRVKTYRGKLYQSRKRQKGLSSQDEVWS